MGGWATTKFPSQWVRVGTLQQLMCSYLFSDSLVKAHIQQQHGSYRVDAGPQPKHIMTVLGTALVQIVSEC